MHTRWIPRLLVFCCAGLAFSCAQAQAPLTGDVTVRLVEGLDSATARPGVASHASVTNSTNAAIPKNSPAVVQLVADPVTGGLGVQLVQLLIGGRQVTTASAGAVLAGGFFGGLNNGLTRLNSRVNNQQVSLTGPHVFLPPNTVVQFTLAATGGAVPNSATAPARTPEPPNVWQPTKPPYSSVPEDTAVSLSVVAVNGSKRGRAHLIVSCTNRNNVSAYFTIAQALIGYKVDDFNNVSGPDQTEADAKAHLDFGGKTTAIFLAGNTGDDSPVRLGLGGPKNGLPDDFYEAANAGKQAKLTILPPDGKGGTTIASFITPSDSAPLIAVASPCIAVQAQEEAERKAKIVASCPTKEGKELVDANVRRTPVRKPEFDEDSGEGGRSWDLTTHPLKAGQHALLDCTYSTIGVAPESRPKIAAPANRVSITLPANAAYCQAGGEPLTADCSRK